MLQIRSSGAVKIVSLNRDRLLARLREIAAEMRTQCPEVTELRLFGSVARQDHTGMSDADVLILLADSAESDPHRRILAYLPYFDLPISIDLLVFTRSEIDQRLADGDGFIARLWAESVRL